MTRRTRARRHEDAGEGWVARPHLARLLRLVIRLSPVAVSALVSWQLARFLPSEHGAARWLVVTVVVSVSLAAGLVTERAARRLLPLTMLLALTMIFPDQAPSRWKVARRAGSGRPLPADRSGTSDPDLAERSLTLLAALTAHDRKTRGHAERVRVFAEMLAGELHLSREDADRLRWAALLHDVGKLEVAATLLNKPGKPTNAEWSALKAHPESGARLAGPLVGWLGEWGLGIAEHHERFDGSGYPAGLSGADISRAGRLLAVVDAYEVMTAARSYKRPMSVAKARLELARCAGGHFDPAMVRAFLAISLPRLLWTTGPLAFLANLPLLAGLQAATRAIPAVTAPASAAAGLLAAGAVVAAIPAQAGQQTPAARPVRTPTAPAAALALARAPGPSAAPGVPTPPAAGGAAHPSSVPTASPTRPAPTTAPRPPAARPPAAAAPHPAAPPAASPTQHPNPSPTPPPPTGTSGTPPKPAPPAAPAKPPKPTKTPKPGKAPKPEPPKPTNTPGSDTGKGNSTGNQGNGDG